MSIRAIDWAFRQATGSSASKLVLIKLADNANDDGRCYPSLAYIAAHCEMHRGTVIRHIKALSDCGLIEVEHRSVDGSKIPNVYRLKLQPVVAECNQGSRTLQPGVVAECNQGSRTLQHRTVIEPSVEPKDTSSPAAPMLAQDADPVQLPAEKPKPAANGTRLPANWVLSQELGEWALTEGLTRDQIRREADSFRDYWIAQPGARGRKADWPATWRNWIRRSTQSAPGGRNNGKPERLSNAERVARDAERHLAELDRLDREDSQMEQGDRALGYDFVPPDRLAVSGESG